MFPPISMGFQVSLQDGFLSPRRELEEPRGKRFSTILGIRGGFFVAEMGSVAVLDTTATANLACFKWLNRRNSVLREFAVTPAHHNPVCARFKNGNGRKSAARFAAGVPVGAACGRGGSTAFLREAELQALLRKGPPGSFGRQLGFSRNTSTRNTSTFRKTSTSHTLIGVRSPVKGQWDGPLRS